MSPAPAQKVLGTRGSALPRKTTVSTRGGMKGGWQGLGLGSPPTMSAPPGSMAACPVLGLAALLFLSAPQASSMVQYRQLVRAAVRPTGLTSLR